MAQLKSVRLYTRQNEKTLEELNRTGRILNRKQYVRLHFGPDWKLFIDSYEFFVEEASKISEKPEYAELPIWCSISEKNCLRPIEGTVCYVLEVPEDKVIYFDDVKWDYVLNRIYLPENEEDNEKYLERIKSLGFQNEFDIFKYKGIFPEEEKIIRESWKRCFEIENFDPFTIVGNLWEIKNEWVKKIVKPGETIPRDDDMI